MHYLTRQRLHISRFHPLMKVLLSLYVLSVAFALWVAALKYTDRAEWNPEGVRLYVVGDGAGAGDPFGDPLAGTEEGLARHEGLTRRQLVDVAHPHLFTVPIVLFILGHLLHLTRLPDRLKLLVNGTAFLAFFATFGLPFVLGDAPQLAGVMIVSGTAFLASCAVLCAILLWETWLGRPGQGFDALPRHGP